MADWVGRYSLAEMRERVRRRIDALRCAQLDGSGSEVALPDLDPTVSNQDIDYYLNYSLTSHAVEMFSDAAQVLSDQVDVDIQTGIVEYALPEDMAQLRGLWWKDPSYALMQVPPSDRVYMWEVSGAHEHETYMNGAPTYHRQLGMFVLNQSPRVDNLGGVQVRYVKWFNPLLEEEQILETEFAPMLQQVLILDAAKQLLDSRYQIDSTRLEQELMKAEARLSIAVRNSTSPPRMTLWTDPAVRSQYFKRSSRWPSLVTRY